jgi:plasmid stabilization system protein ParE
MRLVWFDQAELDIVEHIHFIELRNPSAAVEQDLLVENAISKLVFFPELRRTGRLRYTRELVVPSTSFIAVYRIDHDLDEIHILRILHAKQKWPPE